MEYGSPDRKDNERRRHPAAKACSWTSAATGMLREHTRAHRERWRQGRSRRSGERRCDHQCTCPLTAWSSAVAGTAFASIVGWNTCVSRLSTHQYSQCEWRKEHCSCVNLQVSAREECSMTGWSSHGAPIAAVCARKCAAMSLTLNRSVQQEVCLRCVKAKRPERTSLKVK